MEKTLDIRAAFAAAKIAAATKAVAKPKAVVNPKNTGWLPPPPKYHALVIERDCKS